MEAFVEGYVFADAIAVCERTSSSTPFKWNNGRNNTVIGLNSVKLDKDTVISSYTLLADNVFATTTRSRRRPISARTFSSRMKSYAEGEG